MITTIFVRGDVKAPRCDESRASNAALAIILDAVLVEVVEDLPDNGGAVKYLVRLDADNGLAGIGCF